MELPNHITNGHILHLKYISWLHRIYSSVCSHTQQHSLMIYFIKFKMLMRGFYGHYLQGLFSFVVTYSNPPVGPMVVHVGFVMDGGPQGRFQVFPW